MRRPVPRLSKKGIALSIHPTAIIDRKAELDGSVEIGPYCVIEGNVQVAAGCRLYHGVYLTGWTRIEENCVLHPGVIVGHEPQDTKYGGRRSYCRVGRGTILREYVTIHRGNAEDTETSVGEECFLLAGTHVGHNCVVGDRVTLVNNVLLGGFVEIGDGATLGGQTVAHQFVRIGELVMVAGFARVTRDVVPFAMTNTRGDVAGINRIGMRRAGISQDDMRQIREVYRTVFARGNSFEQAVTRLASSGASGPCARLVLFLTAESKRGVAGRSRRDTLEAIKDA